MEDLVLKEGIITNKELAAWFGLSESTLKKAAAKQKKLEILKQYAEFEITDKGKVNITFVRIPVYNKTRKYDVVRQIVIDPWPFEVPSTVKRQVEKYGEEAVTATGLKATTIANYAYGNKIEMYGVTNDKIGGTMGYSFFETVKVMPDGSIIRLTAAEDLERKKFLKEFFYRQNVDIPEQAVDLEAKRESKEISLSEYKAAMEANHIDGVTLYNQGMNLLGMQWGCTLTRMVILIPKMEKAEAIAKINGISWA